MAQRQRQHRVLNVYGSERAEIIEDAIQLAMEDGAESESDAIAMVCAAYCGADAP